MYLYNLLKINFRIYPNLITYYSYDWMFNLYYLFLKKYNINSKVEIHVKLIEQ